MLTAVHKKIIAHPIAFALIFFCFYFAGFLAWNNWSPSQNILSAVRWMG